VYAKRLGRDNYTKFVTTKEKKQCNTVFAALKQTENGYVILTIFIGEKAGREPWDRYATVEDRKFWKNHALVYDSSEIIKPTLTNNCPKSYCLS